MKEHTALTLAAANLARSAPNGWREFLQAAASYTTTIDTNCIQSPLDKLPVAQGRAQNAREFFGLLENCLQDADRIMKRRDQ